MKSTLDEKERLKKQAFKNAVQVAMDIVRQAYDQTPGDASDVYWETLRRLESLIKD